MLQKNANRLRKTLPGIGASLRGDPIEIRYQSELLDTKRNPAHAATFIRQRIIILDEALNGNKKEHERILIHELFHFVWVRLGNGRRHDWEDLLRAERRTRARGEMGWSAEWRKTALTSRDVTERSQAWREYCCESFCDTAAWMVSGDVSECTLAARNCQARRVWMANELATRQLAI